MPPPPRQASESKTPYRFLNSKLYTKTITTPTGKQKYIRAATKEEKEELERKHQQAKLEIGAGMDTTDSTPFGEFTQLWYNTYKRPNLRENSKENAHYDRLVRLESTAEKVRTATGLSVSGPPSRARCNMLLPRALHRPSRSCESPLHQAVF